MLTFYYYMYGATVNYLKVYISFNGFKRKVWKAHGNMGPTWREGRVMIYSSWPYKVSNYPRI